MSVYLDHAATTPMRPEAVDAFVEQAAIVGNPASLHRPGQRARSALEEAREELAAAVGAHPSEVIFTSGGWRPTPSPSSAAGRPAAQIGAGS